MTDFEKMVTKLKESTYTEGEHFDIQEWESSGKQIDFRPTDLYDDWIGFKYDNNGNLIEIYQKCVGGL